MEVSLRLLVLREEVESFRLRWSSSEHFSNVINETLLSNSVKPSLHNTQYTNTPEGWDAFLQPCCRPKAQF